MEKKEKKKKYILVLLLLLVIIISGVVFYAFFVANKDRLTRDENALGGLLPGKTQAEITDLLNQKVAEGMLDIGIAAEPIFENRGEKGNLGIENVPGNHYTMKVELILKDTGETLYESGLIDPGYYIDFVTLNKSLEPQKHEAEAIFTTYSMDGKNDVIAKTKVEIILDVREGSYYE